MTLFAVVGFFVYTPVMFSGVMSLDLTTKKAVGTAGGFRGLLRVTLDGSSRARKWAGWRSTTAGTRALGRAGLHRDWHHLLAFLWNVRPRG